VKLRFIGKPSDFHLTGEEHAALRRARAVLGDLAPVPVTAGPSERGGSGLDTLTAAVRVLEEHGDEMTLADLAAELGRDPADVLAAVEQGWLLDAGPDETRVLGDLDVLYDDEGDEALWSADSPQPTRDADPKLVRVSVLRPSRGKGTLRHTGLAALGRFAYTAEETQERLTLIARAVAEQPGVVDVDALEAAAVKLRGWAHHLQDHDA
jgi:hypothetical protein